MPFKSVSHHKGWMLKNLISSVTHSYNCNTFSDNSGPKCETRIYFNHINNTHTVLILFNASIFHTNVSILSVPAESNRNDSYLRVELVGNNWNEIHNWLRNSWENYIFDIYHYLSREIKGKSLYFI